MSAASSSLSRPLPRGCGDDPCAGNPFRTSGGADGAPGLDPGTWGRGIATEAADRSDLIGGDIHPGVHAGRQLDGGLNEQDPPGRASILIDNTDPDAPIIRRLSAT